MSAGEEIRALGEKAEELSEVTAKLEEKLAALPFSQETAPVREMLEKMLAELRRMDKNLKAMMRIGGEDAEGGENHGNY